MLPGDSNSGQRRAMNTRRTPDPRSQENTTLEGCDLSSTRTFAVLIFLHIGEGAEDYTLIRVCSSSLIRLPLIRLIPSHMSSNSPSLGRSCGLKMVLLDLTLETLRFLNGF